MCFTKSRSEFRPLHRRLLLRRALAVFDASVIRVAQGGGSKDRFVMPGIEGGEGARFLQLNHNMRPSTLNLGSREGPEVVRCLVQSADVVVAIKEIRCRGEVRAKGRRRVPLSGD